jgi:hypothetical protein
MTNRIFFAVALSWWCNAVVVGAQSHLRRVHLETVVTSSASNKPKVDDGRIVYFQHIHKSGGSTMCRIATLNQMKTSFKTNCNVQEDLRCCGDSDSAHALKAFAESTQYTFVASEGKHEPYATEMYPNSNVPNQGDMYESMDTERFRYIIVFRNSVSRYISHYRHVYRAFDTAIESSFSKWWKTQPDNFIFRKICGTRCQNINKYQISPAIFQYTLDRLAKFEDFVFIERFKDSLTRLSSRIGWTKKPSFIQNADVHDNSFYPEISTIDWDPMMSVLDNALYEYAEKRYDGIDPSFSVETEEKMKEYFTDGPRKACETPCCSPSCSQY